MSLLIEMTFRLDVTNFYSRHQTMGLFFLFATFNCLCFLFGGSSFVTTLSTAKHAWVSTYKTTTANAHDDDENEPWDDTDYGGNAKSQKKQVSGSIHAPIERYNMAQMHKIYHHVLIWYMMHYTYLHNSNPIFWMYIKI